ncbi:MAG: RDD family protein [Actinobacteria bacterium]|nr:RDD family protein [Actinomycetota bacterium]
MWRRVGARLMDALVGLVLVLAGTAVVDGTRLFARLLVAGALIVTYEAGATLLGGATPGKRVAGLRVLEVDEAVLTATAALLRAIVVALGELAGFSLPLLALATAANPRAAAATLLLLGAGFTALVVSTATASLHRGIPDRLAGTVVVDRSVAPTLSAADVERLADDVEPPTTTAWGPLARPEQRRRARVARLDDAPLLLLGLLVVGVAAAAVGFRWQVLLGTLWFAAFVADETVRIARAGATAGHRRAGLAVVDPATGEPPAPARAFARAAVLGLLALAPGVQLIGIPVLLVWMRLSPSGRGPHDLAGRTVVIRRSTGAG